MDTQNTAPLALRVKDFARTVGIGKTKTFAMIKSGELRTVRLGRRLVIPMSEARRLIEGDDKAQAA
jgi:excisionase family DNA binding protein